MNQELHTTFAPLAADDLALEVFIDAAERGLIGEDPVDFRLRQIRVWTTPSGEVYVTEPGIWKAGDTCLSFTCDAGVCRLDVPDSSTLRMFRGEPCCS